MTGTRDLRVLAYSHDGYGLGHVRRNLRVLSALVEARPDVSALAVTGSKSAHEFRWPTGVDYLTLPSLTKVAAEHYVADSLDVAGAAVTALRAGVLRAAAEGFQPDLVLVDRHAAGLHDELLPLLGTVAAARTRSGARVPVVLGLRDILDTPQRVAAEFTSRNTAAVVEQYYSQVLLYGDPSVFDATASYHLPSAVAGRAAFTGYLVDPAPPVSPQQRAQLRAQWGLPAEQPLAVCTVGGGGDATEVAAAFAAAAGVLAPAGWAAVLVTGPHMPAADVAALHAAAVPGLQVTRFVPDLPALLAGADAVLCMGGYNTICEVLSVAARAVVVPRVHPREEQLLRARALQARGLADVLLPDELTPATVAAALRAAAARPAPVIPPELGGGVARAAAMLSALLPARSALPAHRPPAVPAGAAAQPHAAAC